MDLLMKAIILGACLLVGCGPAFTAAPDDVGAPNEVATNEPTVTAGSAGAGAQQAAGSGSVGGSPGTPPLVGWIETPVIKIEDGAAGSVLSGSFVLKFVTQSHLTVDAPTFSIVADSGAMVIDTVDYQTNGTVSFPSDLAMGSNMLGRIAFDADSVDRRQLCQGTVKIIGSVDETTFESDPIMAACD
jgi:hypothetical protein